MKEKYQPPKEKAMPNLNDEPCCMNCKHQNMNYCPFHKGYTGWEDVYCNKWETRYSEGKA